MFVVDPAFDAASVPLAALTLCEARLQLDARFPWLILIPRVIGARELDDLGARDRAAFLDELLLAGMAVRDIGVALERPVEKLNIGLLGNVTPQLHAHVVGRRADDAAWPGPVWGSGGAVNYPAQALARARDAAAARFSRPGAG